MNCTCLVCFELTVCGMHTLTLSSSYSHTRVHAHVHTAYRYCAIHVFQPPYRVTLTKTRCTHAHHATHAHIDDRLPDNSPSYVTRAGENEKTNISAFLSASVGHHGFHFNPTTTWYTSVAIHGTKYIREHFVHISFRLFHSTVSVFFLHKNVGDTPIWLNAQWLFLCLTENKTVCGANDEK